MSPEATPSQFSLTSFETSVEGIELLYRAGGRLSDAIGNQRCESLIQEDRLEYSRIPIGENKRCVEYLTLFRDLIPYRSADGGDRTHTLLPVLDFESSASANSATSAFCEEATCNPFATKRKRTSQEDGSREPVGRSSGAPWKGHLNPVGGR